MSAVPDHVTTSGNDGATGANFECGLMDTSSVGGANGEVVSATNATTGTPSSGTLDELGSGEGILVNIMTADFAETTAYGGVCQGVIYLDENSG